MLFNGMTDEEKALLASICKLGEFDTGDLIVSEGDVGETLLIMRSGRAEVRKKLKSGEHKFLKELQQGDFFGEMSFLDKAARSASVVAQEKCEVLECRMDGLDRLCSGNPVIGAKLYRNMAMEMAARLRKNNEDLKKAVGFFMDSLNE